VPVPLFATSLEAYQARIAERLAEVAACAYYRRPLHLQPAMAPYVPGALDLPGTGEASRTNLALPMGPELSEAAVTQVCQAFAGWSSRSTAPVVEPPC